MQRDSLAKCDAAVKERILANKIPERIKRNGDAELEHLLNALFEEVENDYVFSIRKAIGRGLEILQVSLVQFPDGGLEVAFLISQLVQVESRNVYLSFLFYS